MVYVIAKTIELAIRSQQDRRGIGFDTAHERPVPQLPEIFKREQNRPTHFSIEMYTFWAAACLAGLFDDPEKLSHRRNTVITFNYDLIVDNAMQRFGYEPDYALETPIRSNRRIQLLKLHGSTNWGICGNCRRPTILPHS